MIYEEVKKALMDYVTDNPMSAQELGAKIGIHANTVYAILRDRKRPVGIRVASLVLKFVKDEAAKKPVRAKLNAVETCNLHNAVRAVRGDISTTIGKLTDHLGLQEFNEIDLTHYSKAMEFLSGLQ